MGKAILSQQKQIAARLLHQSELRSHYFVGIWAESQFQSFV